MLKIKKYFLILLLIELLFSYAPAFAQTQTAVYDYSKSGVSDQIKQYLCAPTPATTSQTTNFGNGTGNNFSISATAAQQTNAAAFNSNNGDLFKCINQIYKFAIVVAAVVGVFFIVIAGYVYISSEGNAESVEKAKSIITSTIASLVILFGGYVFLKAINPDLITFNSIQTPSVVGGSTAQIPSSGTGSGTTGGTGTGGTSGGSTGGSSGGGVNLGSGKCQVVSSGVASPSNLQSTCFGSNADKASQIANKETGGNSTLPSGVDVCRDQNGNFLLLNGKNISVSWGLFQINITAHSLVTPSGTLNCPKAFSSMYTGVNKKCSVVDENLYNQCVAAATDASINIQNACQLSSNGNNWGAWANECGF